MAAMLCEVIIVIICLTHLWAMQQAMWTMKTEMHGFPISMPGLFGFLQFLYRYGALGPLENNFASRKIKAIVTNPRIFLEFNSALVHA